MKISAMLVIPALLIGGMAQAETLADAMQQCSKEENSLKRLVCYDRLNKNLRQFENSPLPQSSQQRQTAASDSVGEQPATPSTQMQEFGLPEKSEVISEDKILVSVANKRRNARGKWVLEFTNGQMWEQTDSQDYYFPEGQIYIEKGFLGAFFLGSEESKRRMRVKRIQ
ncbi:hypothetical protein [Lacimicrobium alkaliphilum]|uniref:Uncharacterized protein n=1 Tax=Lacimicrobium alkaliphilum TaxID=1526571 RepID=A0A0U2PKA4_9ALTE|nr:hypothetical protein [Lacimicrobium alkaliphilum]ALT00014.1 hypothetical protein AT746_18235 [Lacimicrobium alkaliphilum]